MYKKIKIPLFAAVLCMVAACSPDLINPDQDQFPKHTEGAHLGNKIDNPYSMNNMRQALANLHQSGLISSIQQIAPTHLYVKLTPQDSAELNRILEDTSLNLFPYPLDYELEGEGPYMAPAGSESDIYTVVPIEHDMTGIPHVVLEECFIPEEEDPDLARLELESMRLTGCISDEEIQMLMMDETKGLWKKPRGQVTVENTTENMTEGVSGVKVLVSWCVKIASCYADNEGNFRINRGYLFDVHYFAVFRNREGYSIYSNWGPILPAIHHVGRHDRRGHNIHIGTGSQAWPWATINNAAHIFYNEMCDGYQITKPHSNLRFWYWNAEKESYTGAAPMLHHIALSAAELALILTVVEPTAGLITTGALLALSQLLPDIIIYQQERTTEQYYKTVFHEMSHAAHYRAVGPLYWTSFIYQICANYFSDGSSYGSKPEENNGVVGVGEMWAYYFDYKCREKQFGDATIFQTHRWFKPQILKEIEERTNITAGDIFQALPIDVYDHEDLKQRMKSLYGYEDIIDDCFSLMDSK